MLFIILNEKNCLTKMEFYFFYKKNSRLLLLLQILNI